jgi:hypothetical protein
MPTTDDYGRPIDQSVVALARSIRKKETNNDYTAKGGSGEYGAYQWMPGNFEAAAKKYRLDPKDRSPVNQDKVAYYTLLEDKQKGLSPEQIAAKWNSGSPTGWENKRGTNKYGQKYDVPAYVAAVMKNFQAEKALAQGGLDPKAARGGLALAPIAEASELPLDQQQQDTPEYDETEQMLMRAAGIQPGQETQMQKPYTLMDIFNDFSVGVAKAELTTAKNIGKVLNPRMVLSFFSPILGSFAPNTSLTDLASRNSNIAKLISDENLTPKNTSEKVGFATERTAEFLAPAGMFKNGAIAINSMIKGSGFLPAAGRVAAKAGMEGIGGGAIALAQTGDLEEAAKTGGLFAGVRGTLGTAGELARAFRIPERIYSSIFKNTYRDVVTELKTAGAAAFQKAHPDEFKALVDQGIIRAGKNGVIQIDDTLAKQALDRGLKGSLKNMANQTVAGLYRAESKVRDVAKNATTKVDVSEKQFQTILRQIAADYKDVGFGEFSQKAKVLADAIKQNKGKVNVETAIAIRRLLDGLRTQASYNAPASRLSLGQQNLKFLANTLRGRVNKVPGMQAVMDDYSFYIDALEHIGKEAARAGNRQIISLLDALFFGGGAVAASQAAGATLGLMRRALTVPSSATRMASAIQNGTRTKAASVIQGIITSLRPFQEDQSDTLQENI